MKLKLEDEEILSIQDEEFQDNISDVENIVLSGAEEKEEEQQKNEE